MKLGAMCINNLGQNKPYFLKRWDTTVLLSIAMFFILGSLNMTFARKQCPGGGCVCAGNPCELEPIKTVIRGSDDCLGSSGKVVMIEGKQYCDRSGEPARERKLPGKTKYEP